MSCTKFGVIFRWMHGFPFLNRRLKGKALIEHCLLYLYILDILKEEMIYTLPLTSYAVFFFLRTTSFHVLLPTLITRVISKISRNKQLRAKKCGNKRKKGLSYNHGTISKSRCPSQDIGV